MKRFYNKFLGKFKKKDPSLTTNTDTLGSISEYSATPTSTIIATTTDPMRFVASPETAAVQVFQSTDVTTAHELETAISNPTPMALEGIPDELASPDAVMQANVRSTESEQTPLGQHSGSGFFTNAQNSLVTGGTFVVNNVNIIPANTIEGKMKIPVPQKSNSSTFFTGRKDVLEKLRKIFIHDGANSIPITRSSCLLWGMGGIGKTQICLKFTEEISDSFSHVFWVDASSHDSITMSIKGISSVPAAQEAGVDASVESVLQWISHIQGDWLIIFDNADDPAPAVVAKFIPSGNRGNILITSRNRSMGRLVSFENSIEIIGMEESDAVTLLLKASCLDHSAKHLQAAKEIVIQLGCIPLAVDQAGAYIEAGNCSINNYLRQFSSHRQTLMSDNTFKGASSYDQTVYGTWDLSFKEIERRASRQSTNGNAQAANAAILILRICAFYHHSNISKDIFKSAAEESGKHGAKSDADEKIPQAITLLDHTLLALNKDGNWDDFVFGQGISVLLSFSLMQRGQSSDILSIHPLMHCWSREQMSELEQQKMCQMGSIILSCAISQRFKSEDYALRRLIFPHIKACELYGIQGGLQKQYYDDKFNNFVLVLYENGDLKNAEHLEVQVVDMRKNILGVEHPSTLTSMQDLAEILYHQGRWDEAQQLQVQVLDMRKKLLGPEHQDTLTSMQNLACIYHDQGRWNMAEQLEDQVLNWRKKLLGPEHEDTLTSMGNLALTYTNQGRWNEAENLQVQVMDMSKKLLGAEHPSTLISMGNLAMTYYNQGRWNEAEHLQVQVMDMSKKLLGAGHPDTLISMGNLAMTYFKQGRQNEAENLQVQVMDMSNKLLGAEHPSTLTSMANLALTYHHQGSLNEAEQLGQQVMAIKKRLLGPEHPNTLISMGNLAMTYSNQGRWNKAEQLEVQVMDIRMKLLGPQHPHTLTSIENLANTYYQQEKWNKAEHLQMQVMNMSKKMLGEKHPQTLINMKNLADVYSQQGRLDDAEQLLLEVRNIEKRAGKDFQTNQ